MHCKNQTWEGRLWETCPRKSQELHKVSGGLEEYKTKNISTHALTGSSCPLGFSTVTSILPLPAEKVSTVKFAGAPTTGPEGSIPGPYARTLLQYYTEFSVFSGK